MIEHVIKTGLASFGMSGIVFHAPLLSSHPGFKFAKVLERTKEKSKTLYPDAEIVRSYDELISDKQIELVVVNTPDNTHYDLTKKALEAGKHVVVEKPFTVTTDEAKKLIDIADRHKRLLSVFQNRRWDNDFLTVQKVIDNKLLGRLVEFESHFDRYRNHIQDSWKDQ